MSDRVCQTCNGPLPTTHGNRKFCSERCRKRSYDLVCVDCGGRVDGTTPSKMADRDTPVCLGCAADHYSRWTADAIIEALQAWTREHGMSPGAETWRAAKVEGADVPTVNHVQYRFGSWNAGLAAAGLAPRPTGRPPGSGLTLEQRAECARRYAAGESSVAIAADLGCGSPTVRHWARMAGVQIRPPMIERRAA